MFNYFKEDFTPVISATVPESQIDLDGKKADIIIALMIETKQTIQKWGQRALTTTSWSVGIVLSIVAYYILHGNSITGWGRFVIGFGVLLFGILTQLYLYSARSNRSYFFLRMFFVFFSVNDIIDYIIA